MSIRSRKKKSFSWFDVIFLLFFLVILYFSYYAINGNNGLLNLIKINNEIQKNKIYLTDLSRQKYILQIKNNGLYEQNLDLDLLEEQAKNFLGYINQKETVVLLNK